MCFYVHTAKKCGEQWDSDLENDQIKQKHYWQVMSYLILPIRLFNLLQFFYICVFTTLHNLTNHNHSHINTTGHRYLQSPKHIITRHNRPEKLLGIGMKRCLYLFILHQGTLSLWQRAEAKTSHAKCELGPVTSSVPVLFNSLDFWCATGMHSGSCDICSVP